MSFNGDSAPSERPRLQLKPRDPEAAKRLEQERALKAASNPFGAAKPREAVLAVRTGKTEEEILKEAVKGERPKLRLNAQQLEERQAAEAIVESAKAALADAPEDASLQAEVSNAQAALDTLLDKFEQMTLEAIARGEIQRPSERKQLLAERDAAAPADGQFGGRGNYSRDRTQYNPTREYEGSGGRGAGGAGRYGDRPAGGSFGDREGGNSYGDRQYNDKPYSSGEQGSFGGGRGGGGGSYGGRGGGRGGYSREGGEGAGSYSRGGGYSRNEYASGDAAGGADPFVGGGGGGGYQRGGRTGGEDTGYSRSSGNWESGRAPPAAGGGASYGGGGRGGRGGYSRLDDYTSYPGMGPPAADFSSGSYAQDRY